MITNIQVSPALVIILGLIFIQVFWPVFLLGMIACGVAWLIIFGIMLYKCFQKPYKHPRKHKRRR